MPRLLASNHGERLERRRVNSLPPLRLISFYRRACVSISIRVLFVSSPPRATRARTKDAFLPMLHQADATGAAARPRGKLRKKKKKKKKEGEIALS